VPRPTGGIAEQGLPVAIRGALFLARSGHSTAAARRSAFTLGELAALVAATGIVISVAYSAYDTYRIRHEVDEGITVASELIPAVTEFFQLHGEVPMERQLTFPAGTLALSTTLASSTVVGSVTVVDGRIDVLYGPLADRAIAGRQISLTPYETVDRHVVWICGDRKPGPGLEPLGFAGGGRTAVQLPTTIESRYLSRWCR
jgi:type IV pilus assembly protein PilA